MTLLIMINDLRPHICQEQHLICSHCRPKVKECPECRVVYQGPPRRHRSVARVNMMAKHIDIFRYAEKTAEELRKLEQEFAQLTKS